MRRTVKGLIGQLFRSLVLGMPVAAPALDHVWLVGGGPDPYNAQAQIEHNVVWARAVLDEIPGQRRIEVYFNDGTLPARDVIEWRQPAESPDTLQPLARVFNSYWNNGESFRNHRIRGVTGGTNAGDLRQRLSAAFARLRDGDRALFVFNGHGALNEADTSGNTIELWGNTALSVDDVRQIFDQAPRGVPLRFIFTQCYAGAFAQLADPGKPHCGFLAEAEDRPAEGCSASLELGQYRDYSTYFFAALAGRTRGGEALPVDPDENGDGRVSAREAHLYTLRAGDSSDIPRSTSEDLLLRWLPWYLDWAVQFDLFTPANVYARLARQLAQGRDEERDRAELQAQRSHMTTEQENLAEAIAELREPLEDLVMNRWPEAATPYTLGYKRFLVESLDAAQAYILGHPDYPALRAKQDAYWTLERKLIDNERQLSRIERANHLRRLGRVLELFHRFADETSQARYRELLACENQSP